MPFTASVIPAADWGAVPPKDTCEETTPKYILIHHTDTPNPPSSISKGTVEGAKKFAKSIQNTHMNTNGWNDSGHNFLNTVGGYLLEGRQGTLAAIIKGSCVRSAHAGNKAGNESPGIENEGTFMTHQMEATQWNSLVDLCTSICSACNIDPANIKGHRDFKSTDCPGDWLYSQLPRLRQEVQQRLAPPTTPLKKGSKGQKVKDAQLYLKYWGFDPGPIDGIFGSGTEAALIAFQKAKNLAADGVIEAKTWKALVTSPPPQPPQSGTLTLVDVCKSYKGSNEQIQALDWLQAQIPKMLMDEFTNKWRNQSSTTKPVDATPLPLTMVNVCKYYRCLPHQNESLDWLKGQISKDIFDQFLQKWPRQSLVVS